MSDRPSPEIIAFTGDRRIAVGSLRDVAVAVKAALGADADLAPLMFDTETSQPVEIDLRGSAADILARLPQQTSDTGDMSAEAPAARGPGRPKLGVVAREITLLPRHWEWLATQPGGASVAIRKLVEEARRATTGKDRARRAQEAAYRFMAAMAGNKPNYEEALRALYANDASRFEALIAPWPADVRTHVTQLAARAFAKGSGENESDLKGAA